MIDRYPSSGPTMGLRQVMDRLLEDAVVMPRGGDGDGQGWGGPALNVYEEGDQLTVQAQVPGLKPEDLDINVEQGVLTISGQTTREEERKERNYLVREHRTGRFSRSLRLPATYDVDACTASFEHGVLKLAFPKSEAAKPHRIQVGGASQPAMTNGQEKTRYGQEVISPKYSHERETAGPLRRALAFGSTGLSVTIVTAAHDSVTTGRCARLRAAVNSHGSSDASVFVQVNRASRTRTQNDPGSLHPLGRRSIESEAVTVTSFYLPQHRPEGPVCCNCRRSRKERHV